MIISIPIITFASNNIAYCIGSEDGNTGFVVNNAKSYYVVMGYDTRTYIDPSSTLFGSMLNLNPEILLIASHSDPRGIGMMSKNTGISTGSQNWFDSNGRLYYGVQRYSWSNSAVVILGGCSTAPDSNSNNICKQISDLAPRGAVIGWKDTINNVDLDIWVKKFSSALAVGYVVADAVDQANSYSDYNNDSIKNVRVYGVDDILLNSTYNLNVNTSDIEINIPHNINYNVPYTNENDMVNINNMLTKEFEGYNPNDYELKIIDGQKDTEKIINLRLKINNFVTNNGYVIFVKDNKVDKLYNNHTYTNNELNAIIKSKNLNSIKISDYTAKINEYKEITSNNIKQKIEDSINTNQEVKLYYDIDLGKKYLSITTENKIGNAVAYYVDKFEI